MSSQANDPTLKPYVLGLDIGANSIGWAAIAIDPGGQPLGFLNPPGEMRERPTLGVRIFDAGIENYGQGKREEGRGQKRRSARLARRQTMRRARRVSKTFRMLQELQLLPPNEARDVTERGRSLVRDSIIKKLDELLGRALAGQYPERASEYLECLPYALRVDALDRALSIHELGRALFHLAQRRGFLSNRKGGKKTEDTGPVYEGINEIEQAMAAEGCRTLGEHFLHLQRSGKRIRTRWTARRMYEAEFDAIWEAQRRHHPDILTDAARRRLHRAIFFQRALRSQSSLIGACELECGDEYVNPATGAVARTKKRRRAPECLLVSQRFRLLQRVNDLAVDPGEGLPRIPLTDEQRVRLAAKLEVSKDLTFPRIAEVLGLKRGTKFNLQAGGEKKLVGNQTNAKLFAVFGDRWVALTPTERDQVVLELWGAPDDKVLYTRARSRSGIWGSLRTTTDEAREVSEMPLPSDYMALSKHAMSAVLVEMERGVPYTTAVRTVYGERMRHEKLDRLPPVMNSLGSLRNPTVMRALTEVRRVVNHLLAAYGLPVEIRVELARDLKKSKDERNRIIKMNREHEELREKAAARILEQGGIRDVRGGDILKVRLADECNWTCPYTGKQFGMAQLLGEDIDIEHIIPYSMSLDDSYVNKTVCFANVNRSEKRNQTPYAAFGHDEERWTAMLERMEHNVGEHDMSPGKLERFRLAGGALAEALDHFKSSQLNDTRYASRAAKEYLAVLYGGNVSQGVDSENRKRVMVGNGQATSLVRRQLGLESVCRSLPGWPGGVGRDWDKRADHRHHAMDAIAIALTGPRMIQQLSRAAESGFGSSRRASFRMAAPWDAFEDDAARCLEHALISFRIDNRARGPLHAETIYSPPRGENGAVSDSGTVSHVRKPVSRLTASDFEAIVDPRVRRTVSAFFGDRDPAKVCQDDDPATFPHLDAADGRRIPIRRVRLRKRNSLLVMGSKERTRHVENEANHHLVVRRSRLAPDTVSFELVSMFEAVRRRSSGEGVWKRDEQTLVILARNDLVELTVDDRPRLCRVQSTSSKEFEGCWIADARPFDVRRRTGGRVRISPSQFMQRACRKFSVSPIGVLRPCRA